MDTISVTSMTPFLEEMETLHLPTPDGTENNPFKRGLGEFYDIDGGAWDVRAVIGGVDEDDYYVCARPAEAAAVVEGKLAWLPHRVVLIHS